MNYKRIIFWLVVLGVLALITLFAAFVVNNENNVWEDCEKAGGHMYARERTTICLDKDGRVIEV